MSQESGESADTNTQGMVVNISTSFTAKEIIVGSYRFKPDADVVVSRFGIRIVAPIPKRKRENVTLDIEKSEILRIAYNFDKCAIMFIYMTKRCGSYIRKCFEIVQFDEPHFDPLASSWPSWHEKRLICQVDNLSEEAKAAIKTIFSGLVLDEIKSADAIALLEKSAPNEPPIKPSIDAGVRQILLYPPPEKEPHGIELNTDDYECLAKDKFLNPAIVEFYIKYLQMELLTSEQRSKSHFFSPFFYHSLTTARTGETANDVRMSAAGHLRVKDWTKDVNLFEKDYIVIPINKHQHWFLAIICFPRLSGQVAYDTMKPVKYMKEKAVDRKSVQLQIGGTTITPVSKRDSEKDEAEGAESDAHAPSDEGENEVDPSLQTIKHPCILIFDSLAGTSRNSITARLRYYLSYESGRAENQSFDKYNMPSYTVKVPQQNKYTDCGVYLLQFVEHFFTNPIKDYRQEAIDEQLSNWFDSTIVTRKRECISSIVKKLVGQFNPENLPLLDSPLPTVDATIEADEGKVDEQDGKPHPYHLRQRKMKKLNCGCRSCLH